MPTTEENRAARAQYSREQARASYEAYRDAKRDLLAAMDQNRRAIEALEETPMTQRAYHRARIELRKETRQLNEDARNLGIPRTKVADMLGVTRTTIHQWLNEEQA